MMAKRSTPAHWFVLAAREGRTDEVLRMLDSGAVKDVNVVDDVDLCCALVAAAGRGHRDTCDVLLRRGAAVDACGAGRTALHSAASSGYTDVCALLLSHGADVMSQHREWTPLHCAALYGHLGVCALLLSCGADARCASKFRNTPLHLAGGDAHPDIVSLLLEEAADTHALNQAGLTPHAETIRHAGLFNDKANRLIVCQDMVAYGECYCLST